MPENNMPSTTQRAYTLRLRGMSKNDQTWRDALWQTHEAVNKGAKAFGDWLLTLRGGLDHTLADEQVKGKAPTDDQRKDRRILLALSWLSVESREGAPEKFIVPTSEVVNALPEILKKRGLSETEIEAWVVDCRASLSSAIRDDAVWVNRSAAFDEAAEGIESLTRAEIWDMLEPFFASPASYLTPTKLKDDESEDGGGEEKAKDLVQKAGQWLSSRFGTGKGADFERMAKVYKKMADWADTATPNLSGEEALTNLANYLNEFEPTSDDLKGVLGLISGPGYKSATRNILDRLDGRSTVSEDDLTNLKEKASNDAEESRSKTGGKGLRPYANRLMRDIEVTSGFAYRVDENDRDVSVTSYDQYDDDYKWGTARHSEYAVMLDHAARRVSLAHTWIKRAEAERSKFEEDARKIGNVPDAAKKWLDAYCLERSGLSGALEGYRIRKRAVDAWKEVVAAWNKKECKSEDDRITAARAMQDDPEIDKFGDIQLFEALAADDAQCVWHADGDTSNKADAQILLDYVAAGDAQFKKQKFKVPAYRHPDELLHPVFCDFGNSRWSIDFSIREAATKLGKAKEAVAKAREALEKNRDKGDKEAKAKEKLEKAENELAKAREEVKRLSTLHRMNLKLWNGTSVTDTALHWQSKKLAQDLAINSPADDDETATEVSRADRLGRAAVGVPVSRPVSVTGLFEQDNWNGRLQAPRQQLDAIAARVEKHGWDEKARKMRDNLQWLVTFSAKLQPQGPWCDFAHAQNLRPDPQYWPHSTENKKRNGQGKLILTRLPGLRVLSADLGHRYAASCAVWETITTKQMKEACKEKGHPAPNETDLYLHLKDGKKTTIYRRIGADTLEQVDEATGEVSTVPHPAPWARLDRQFIIKLQGEETEPRKASCAELCKVLEMEEILGYVRSEDNPLPKQVDELMFGAVKTLRLALNRHGDRARIAHYLIADEKSVPGGTKKKLDENGRIELLQDALVLWHGLFSSRRWNDDAAKRLWEAQISKLPGYESPEETTEDDSGKERKEKQKRNRAKFKLIATALAHNNEFCARLHITWKTRWEEDDAAWKKRLRWYKDWILPRGEKAKSPSIRHVGGLSLTRIATLTEFRRKVQVGFYTRMGPAGTKCEAGEGFGQGTLDALEHLREQRVKQLASRIAEAALGVGRMKRPKSGKDPKRPQAAVDKPCHAVVIENLTHYRPKETRTRRENRQLMSWSSSKVKKYLGEACQLHGLHLREVQASYTSRQDSRTGAPGMRCQDVPVKDFMQKPWWRKEVEKAKKETKDPRSAYILKLNEFWSAKKEEDWKKTDTIRIPVNGGEVFVSADASSPAAKGLQADLNAAANIGLKALLDPDWPGKWWYVPCESNTFKPLKDKVGGSSAVDTGTPLFEKQAEAEGDGTKKKKGKGKKGESTKEVVNLWRDISTNAIAPDGWKFNSDYKKDIERRVIDVLSKQLPKGKALDANGEEIPY